jgi:putative membrane protein
MEHAYCWGGHFHWIWVMPFFFMVLFLVFGCRSARHAGSWRQGARSRYGWWPDGCCGPSRGSQEHRPVETPEEILDRRYAQGEITKEQYKQMKSDITAGDPGSFG